MNLWDWVCDKEDELRDAGHVRLADLIDKIPEDACDDNHAELDLYVEEAIQLAKDVKEPWVEIFIRHWRLQSKVLHRVQPKGMLKEAVELLEFSHRPENIECPQSICVVQDLASCYGAIDGPGYYQERIDVCEETLKRITPRWSCYECVSSEHASALHDNGEYEAALAKINETEKQLELLGEDTLSAEVELQRVLVLIELGQYDSAKRNMDRIDLSDESAQCQMDIHVYHSLICAYEGKCDEALNLLPRFEELKQYGDLHHTWVEIVSLCATEQSAIATQENLDTCMQVLLYAEERGAYRDTLEIGSMVAQLCHTLGSSDSALHALALMKRAQSRLHVDLGASKLVESVSIQISAV